MGLSEDRRGGHIAEGPAMGRAIALLLLLLHTCCALEVSAPSSLVGIVHTDALLPCTFKVVKPPINLQYLAIFWHFGQKEIARYDTKTQGSTSRFVFDEQAVKQGNASLTIHHVAVSDKGTYTCTVVYTPDTEAKKILLNILAVPVVILQKNAVVIGVASLLQCSITNFFPKDMKVIWLKNGKSFNASAQDDRMNADMTFTRNSSVNVTFVKEHETPNITCQVEHDYLQDPIKDSYSVQYGAAPKVRIKASRTPDGNDQIYMCEAANYSPEDVTMRWLLDGKRIDSPRQSNNGYFNKEIYYRIQLGGNNPPSQISCEVQHETLKSPIEMTVERGDYTRRHHFSIFCVLLGLLLTSLAALWYYKKKDSIDSQRFQVGPIHKVQSEEKVTLYCTASNCPEDVEVTWTIVESNKEKHEIPDNKKEGNDEEAALNVSSDYEVDTERSREDNLHHAISILSFTPIASKHKKVDVSCKFLCNKQVREKSLTCSFTFKKPELSGSVQMSLGDGGDVLCSFFMQNICPTNIKIKWSHGLGHFQDVETLSETFPKNENYTSNVRSVCRVPGCLLKDPGYRIRATWTHNRETGQKEVSLADSDWRPVMGEIKKPDFIDGREAKLLCRISGYFPDVLDVKWLRRDAESEEFYVLSDSDKYKIPVMEATQQEDKTFTYTACLTVSVSLRTDYGAELMCRVRHPSMQTPMEKRTGEIRVIGILAVNVMRVIKDNKIRAQVSHFTPKDIKITWSRTRDKKNYEEYTDVPIKTTPNTDGTNTAVSEITVKRNIVPLNERKHYKVVVEHEASRSVIQKIILREDGEFYLIDNDNKKSPLAQMSDLKQERNVNGDNQVSSEEKPTEPSHIGDKKKKGSKSGKKTNK